jgi:membrane-associated protease RseP (regulator of RpoE activity)
LGHYLACRRHRLDATLPYFLPVPFGIGTFGAFIRIKTPLRAKRELLDVGAAGPLAGFVVALPILWLGIALSQPTASLPDTGR